MNERYQAAMHAMQSGVAAEMQIHEGPTTPKHLRVGINSALVNDAALSRVLIAKGVLTLEELEAAVTTEMEAEAKRYEARLTDHYGRPIQLA